MERKEGQGLSPRVAVVGAGIAGLTAAWRLAGHGLDVTLLEATAATGGKLRASPLCGVAVDEGAEAFLARRPEALDLARQVGLGAELVNPSTSAAAVWTRGALRPLPAGQLMGVPGDLRALAASGLVSTRGLLRVAAERLLPPRRLAATEDVAVGEYLTDRLGREVVERLVEPLLGGVYAGHADQLSLAAAAPQLAALARSDGRLLAGAARAAARARPAGPVFASLTGGAARLAAAVTAAFEIAGGTLATGAPVRELRRTETGWSLLVGDTRQPTRLSADAVVLALPARPAARLLARDCPGAAGPLSGLDYASMAIITLAFERAAFPAGLTGSGFLVPPAEGRLVKAATFASLKWGWLAQALPDATVVRLSVGRHGEEAALQRDDSELVALAVAELVAAAGVTARPVAQRVTRWGGALPQYTPGHLERVAGIRRAVAALPGLAVCGAAYDGVGIPACVASAHAAADAVLAYLTDPAGRLGPPPPR